MTERLDLVPGIVGLGRLVIGILEVAMGRVEVNAAYVESRLEKITENEDLSRFIL